MPELAALALRVGAALEEPTDAVALAVIDVEDVPALDALPGAVALPLRIEVSVAAEEAVVA